MVYIYPIVKYSTLSTLRLAFAMLLFWLACASALRAQQATEAQLRQKIAAAPADSNKVLLWLSLGQTIEGNDPEAAKQCYRAARALAQSLKYAIGEMKYYTNYTAALNLQGRYDSGLLLNIESLAFAKKIKSPAYIAAATGNIGTSYMQKEDYEKALQYQLEALALLEELQDTVNLCIMYSNIGAILGEMGQHKSATPYHRQAVAMARYLNDSNQIGATLSNAGINYTRQKKYDSATLLLQEANAVSRKIPNSYLVMNTLFNLNNVLMATGQYAKMPPLCKEALGISQALGDKGSEAIAYHGLASAAFFSRQYDSAYQLAYKSLAAAQAADYKDEQGEMYDLLSALALTRGDLADYDRFRWMSAEFSDAVMNQSIVKNTQALQAKYQATKREAQIAQLEKEKAIRQQWIYILSIAAAALLLTGLVGRNYYQQKKLLQQQHIEALENEKQLMATQAMLKGQEAERSRVAKDLHDGIGGMLSGIKLTLGAMKGNMILSENNARLFAGALHKLDDTIAEMRRVAHSMMPEALLRLGLGAAVADYCAGVDASGPLKLSYQQYGLEQRLPAETEIVVYRMVQELITNVLKHANASQVLVQLIRQDGLLMLTVEDDGVGMPSEMAQNKGAGLRNLQARADYLKATLDVKSSPGKGTSVHLEIPLL